MAVKFSEFMDDLRAEAKAEGPAAVAELDAFHAEFRLSLEFLARRKALGLTQVEVARRAGVPQPVVSRFERGALNPTYLTLSGLAKALECQIQLVSLGGKTVAAKQARATSRKRGTPAPTGRANKRRPARAEPHRR